MCLMMMLRQILLAVTAYNAYETLLESRQLIVACAAMTAAKGHSLAGCEDKQMASTEGRSE